MNVAPSTTAPKLRRILYVITKANWGGAQRYVYDLAVAAKNGDGGERFEVTVACGDRGELCERLTDAGVEVVIVPGLARDISVTGDFKALKNLIRLMQELQPDIVHANSSKAGLIATLAARLTGVHRIIFTAHGWAFNESRPWWQKVIFAKLHTYTVWMSHITICVSEAVRRDAWWMPFTRKKFRVIHLGITPATLVSKDEARAKLAPATDESTKTIRQAQTWIGTLAELHPTKGLDIAIKAFAKIAPHFPDTALVMIGEGQDRGHLTKLVSELNLTDRVHFCGQVRDAATILKAFDIFLFPSRSEALGYAALEAGNASLSVIASDVGGIPEIIEDHKTGVLVKVGDIDGFVSALTSLLENPEQQKDLGDSLHEYVFTDFSKTLMQSKTVSLYS